MNKKVFLIPIAVGLVVLFIINIFKTEHHGSKAEMSVPSASEGSAPKTVNIIFDNSGSMQGYINFASKVEGFESAKHSLVSNVADFMGNVDACCAAPSVAFCGTKTYNTENLIKSLTDYSLFRVAVTELDGLVRQAIEKAGDTAVSVVVTDMVLSYGGRAIDANGPNYNHQRLSDLATTIGNQFKNIKNNIGVLILKYESDFNGSYYYNCTENRIPSNFKNTLMKKRPYYFFVIGKSEYIKNLCSHNCFPAPESIFTSLKLNPNTDMAFQPYTVETTANSTLWMIGGDDANAPLTIWSKNNLGDNPSSFVFNFDKIEIPLYATGILAAKYDNAVVDNVSFDKDALNSFNVTLKGYSSLPKFATTEISLQVEHLDEASESSIDLDYDVEPASLEGRTWGFSSIIEKIYSAYGIDPNGSEEIAKLTFAVSKK